MSKTESFEFLNELALAFRAAENHPRPAYAPVLEGIRAVLAHLTAAGHLIPAGGMALTAKQVEDVRAAREELRGYRNFTGYGRSHVNQLIAAVDALFPATEPAERVDHGSVDDGMGSEWQRCKADCGIEVVRPGKAQCDCTEPTDEDEADDISGFMDALKASRAHNSAPAEPAEEETKAEALQEKVADLESQLEEEIANRDRWEQRLTNLIYSLATVNEVGEWTSSDDLDEKFIDHIGGKIQQLERAALAARGEGWYEGYEVGLEYGPIAASGEEYDGPINPYDVPVSSPVVPAPTETGPWPTAADVPEGVQYYGINGWGPTYYVNRGGVRYRVFDDTPSKAADYVVQNFAPFVAAEEG